MKQALRARLKDNNWVDQLPWVLLGIRTMPKEDLNASSAELVYGAPLTVPGDFSPIQPGQFTPSVSAHLDTMRHKMDILQPPPMSRHGEHRVHMPKSLQTSSYVFVRKDGYHSTLATPYSGPYKVIEHGVATADRPPPRKDYSEPPQASPP